MAKLESTSEDTRIYEICVLLPYPLSQKEENDTLKAVEDLFAEADGKQISKDVWGRRGLAYNIGGFDEGNYVVYYYELNPEKLDEMDTNMRITPNVLRHIIVKPPKGYEIVEYSKEYEAWLKEKDVAEEEAAKAEEEKLKQKILDKQKRQAKRSAKKEEPEPAAKEEAKPEEAKAPKKAEDKEEISAEIDKLISDDDLEF